MEERIFQEIFELLAPTLPEGWARVVLYVEYGESSYSMKYFVDSGDGSYVDCYKLKDMSRGKLAGLFIRLNKVIGPVRDRLSEKERWTVLTMRVSGSGQMKADFSYGEPTFGVTEEWKKTYLN